jgi:S-DNA-T family DNA segregation ATPase FtsK/SpoIIIE
MTTGQNDFEELEELLTELADQNAHLGTPYSEEDDVVTQTMQAELDDQQWLVQITPLDRRMMSLQELQLELQSGLVVNADTLVWRGGMEEWAPVALVAELSTSTPRGLSPLPRAGLGPLPLPPTPRPPQRAWASGAAVPPTSPSASPLPLAPPAPGVAPMNAARGLTPPPPAALPPPPVPWAPSSSPRAARGVSGLASDAAMPGAGGAQPMLPGSESDVTPTAPSVVFGDGSALGAALKSTPAASARFTPAPASSALGSAPASLAPVAAPAVGSLESADVNSTFAPLAATPPSGSTPANAPVGAARLTPVPAALVPAASSGSGRSVSAQLPAAALAPNPPSSSAATGALASGAAGRTQTGPVAADFSQLAPRKGSSLRIVVASGAVALLAVMATSFALVSAGIFETAQPLAAQSREVGALRPPAAAAGALSAPSSGPARAREPAVPAAAAPTAAPKADAPALASEQASASLEAAASAAEPPSPAAAQREEAEPAEPTAAEPPSASEPAPAAVSTKTAAAVSAGSPRPSSATAVKKTGGAAEASAKTVAVPAATSAPSARVAKTPAAAAAAESAPTPPSPAAAADAPTPAPSAAADEPATERAGTSGGRAKAKRTAVAAAATRAPSAATAARNVDSDDAAGKPGSTFDRAAAKAALDDAATKVKNCRPQGGPSGTGTVQLSYEPTGKVASVSILTPKFDNTTAGSCIVMLFRRATVPAFTGASVIVMNKAFEIP